MQRRANPLDGWPDFEVWVHEDSERSVALVVIPELLVLVFAGWVDIKAYGDELVRAALARSHNRATGSARQR